jgi:hypothetical protein
MSLFGGPDLFSWRKTRKNPPSSMSYVIFTDLPLEVRWGGRRFRLEVDVDSVSRKAGLFAVDLEDELCTPWLLTTAKDRQDLETRIKHGFEPNGMPGVGILLQLEKEGKARRFRKGGF